MPLEETLDNLDGVDEKYQDLYVENSDGKFEIDISGLKSALVKERKLKKDYEKKLAKNKVNKDDDPDLDELKKELKTAKGTISNMKINSRVKSAAISAGVDPNYIDDVVILTRSNFGLDDDGNVVGVDADGSPDGKNINNFFKNDFKRNKPRFFISSGRQGTGSFESDDGVPLSHDGKINKTIKSRDVSELIKLKQSKINKK